MDGEFPRAVIVCIGVPVSIPYAWRSSFFQLPVCASHMERETRRSVPKTTPMVFGVSLGGCPTSDDTGNGGGNGGNDGTTPPSEPSVEQYLEISTLRRGSYYLRFNAENVIHC